MPVHPTKRCDKCFHSLPYRRRTWRPSWAWWAEPGGSRLTYAADGPPLGYVIEFSDEETEVRYYRAYVLSRVPERGKAWPSMEEVPVKRGTQRECIRAVESAVRERVLWNPRRCT